MKINLNKNVVQAGCVAFIVLAAAITFYFALENSNEIFKVLTFIKGILAPFIYGLVMAYLLCPIYNRVFKKLYKKSGSQKIANAMAVSISMLVLIGVLASLLWAVIPNLIQSVVSIAQSLPQNTENLVKLVKQQFEQIPLLSDTLSNWTKETSANFVDWIQKTLEPNYKAVVVGVSGGVVSILVVLKNFLIGIIVCALFLANKDTFVAQSKKAIFALFSKKRADDILRGASFAHQTFGAFINGKIVDSLIIGILCFVFMSLFGWPYATLISVVIGVTNIIPFFGPFIGAFPASVLMFTVDPVLCLYFMLFILGLQQFDGNILGPKILGDATGIPMFWVMFAILVGGGLLGFFGMVIGIPVFAIIFVYIGYKINSRLEQKGLSTDLECYKDVYVDLSDGREGPWHKREKKYGFMRKEKNQDVLKKGAEDEKSEN